MEKLTKKYVNCLVLGREWESKEVDIQEPENVDTTNVISFYFYEQSFINDGGDIYIGKQKKCSPVYHLGKRISITEALEICKKTGINRPLFEQLYKNNSNASICQTELGYLFLMDEDAITLEEYINSKDTNKKITKTIDK